MFRPKVRKVFVLRLSDSFGPFEQWFMSIEDSTARKLILAKISRLGDPEFRGHKAVGAGIYELRVFFGPGYRIYFGMVNNMAVALVGGGDKGKQEKDIYEAKKAWKIFKTSSRRNLREFSD